MRVQKDVENGKRPCKMAANNTTPLHLAVQEGRLEVLRSGKSEGDVKEHGKKMEKENIGRIMRYDSVRRCKTCMEFADHETHWCVVFVVPSAC